MSPGHLTRFLFCQFYFYTPALLLLFWFSVSVFIFSLLIAACFRPQTTSYRPRQLACIIACCYWTVLFPYNFCNNLQSAVCNLHHLQLTTGRLLFLSLPLSFFIIYSPVLYPRFLYSGCISYTLPLLLFIPSVIMSSIKYILGPEEDEQDLVSGYCTYTS